MAEGRVLRVDVLPQGGQVNCVCHDEPMYWQKAKDRTAGGHWICAVKRRRLSREFYARNRERRCAQMRERYDSDPVHRIKKLLREARRKRALVLADMKERMDGTL